ncbi:ankyrin repeat domain-containing protein [Rhodopirellula sp. SWK7]|uniref:ankyrin repeat domain-containing protein n=1 Tax=Rhodopirellula sp. SWK7 TaxID=595460 RepID=UPI0002BDD7C7|nr:ankyrin repeat domain-containing protein [Rhodopirellula sp. SWK7]EMI47366.1 ankyrin repeat protein [Rhodopirellula sp. SWK7]
MPNHPIFAPTFHGDVAAVMKLLNDDATLIAVRDAKNLTPLHVAASRGQSGVAQLLIYRGADVHGPSDDDEWTPLVFASYRGHYEVAKVLIENGAGVTDNDGNPIHYSGQRKHKDICRLLVEHGAIDDLIDSNDSDVLKLFRAAYSYDSDAVNEILARRPELVDCKDKDGRTALHEACTHGDTKTVRALLKCGADVTVRDANGQIPADRAEAHNQHAVTKLIEKHNTAA